MICGDFKKAIFLKGIIKEHGGLVFHGVFYACLSCRHTYADIERMRIVLFVSDALFIYFYLHIFILEWINTQTFHCHMW